MTQLKAQERVEERKHWSPYNKELNNITSFTYKGELHVYPGQHKLPDPVDKGMRMFGKPVISALKKL